MFLNEKTRIALMVGIDADLDTGEAFLAGFNTPIPATLLDVIKEYHENNYPLDAIINFWKLLMINPDKRVRTSLFDFIKTHDFVLTSKGYMLVYKAVYVKGKEDETPQKLAFDEYVSNQYLTVKSKWKCAPNKYVVYINPVGEYCITKIETAESWDEKEKKIEIIGKLGDLYASIILNENKNDGAEKGIEYTDCYSQSMTIRLGEPTSIERVLCDSDPAYDCSNGLHVGATGYVQKYGGGNRPIIVCLVNPANVVAVPHADHSKMRVSEYFPIGRATYENGKIEIVEQKYFEDDYCNYEIAELENQIAKVKAEELPIETAIKAETENRPMAELMKMLENRLLDIV